MSFLRKRYPSSFSEDPIAVSQVYLDANAMLYNIAEVTKKPQEIAQLLLDAAKEYSISYKAKVNLAIDGPAHMGKVREQRARRFNYPPVTVISKDESQPGQRQGSIPVTEIQEWSPAMFSPGTEMMEQIHQYLQQNKGGIGYSSFYEPGEGEHKIIRDIRLLPAGSSVAITGKDADLLLLGMILVEQGYRVWIVRHNDTSDTGKADGYRASDPLWNINCMSLRQQILTDIDKESIWEFILSLMIVGNDFLPASKDTASLRDVAPLIIQALKQTRSPMYVGSQVQWNAYLQYLQLLNQKLQGSTEVASELYYNQLTPFPAPEDKLVQAWKTTVEWNTKYYEQGLEAASRSWQYPIFYAPTIYSMLKYITTTNVFPTTDVPPLQPHQALAAVLPPWLRNLLPENISEKLREYPQYYPYAFQLIQKPGHTGDGVPLIPNIPYEVLASLQLPVTGKTYQKGDTINSISFDDFQKNIQTARQLFQLSYSVVVTIIDIQL